MMQGPVPTDHGCRRLRNRRTDTIAVSVTGPLYLRKHPWPTVGVGLHLLSLAYAGTVVRASLAGMTDDNHIRDIGDIRDLAEIPAVEVITRAAVMLMSAAAEKIGLSSPDPDAGEHRDLDEARRLITALAGLVTASAEYLGPHAGPVRDGLKSLQLAFREASAAPDDPGHGPGEKYTGPVW